MTTRRGREISVRHIEPEDADLLIDLFKQLSPRTRWLRFFSAAPDIPDEVLRREASSLSNIDPLLQAALIATAREGEREYAVGVARLVRTTPDSTTAEIAVVVRDDYQGEGIGATLLDLITQVAMVRGIKQLQGYTLAENAVIQGLVRKSGLPFSIHTSRGETTVTISLSD
jgi:acetyltransferase